MPAAGGRRGRRDNGLVAAQYSAAGDVDPRIGEHLLDVLAAGGIAAYLQPSTDLHPITRATDLPARPTDRLFVDREHVGTAREYIRQVAGEPERATAAEREPEPGPGAIVRTDTGRPPDRRVPGGTDVDAAWNEIVAGFNVTIDPTDAPWPRSEEVHLDEPRPLPHIEPPSTSPPARRRTDPPVGPSLLDGLDTFGVDLPDEEADGYTPPAPPPLPRLSTAAAVGAGAVATGLLLFIWPDLMPVTGDLALLLPFALVVAGFGTLVWRLRPGDDEDDDFDDGARV